uniref:Uncharacterized protein n=1 Tax=Moumouvirus sp. 'Monve' TaxID=1128131 RepID=H2EFZ2_9VIRU|nr:hypothetical protein mv_R842 [Moumouvirus Monve]
MYNYYKFYYNSNEFDKNNMDEYPDLFCLFKAIYSDLCSKRSKDLIDKLKATKYYMNHPTSFFNFKYENGLLMFNENNNINICDFFPEFMPMDKILSMIYVDTKNNLDKITLDVGKNKQQKKPRKHKFLQKDKEQYLVLDTFNNINTVNKETLEKEDNKDLVLFKSDKNSYKLIKNDIEKGILDNKDINAFFADKFIIFKLLESRGCLNLDNNDDIKTEYELFRDLYEPEENIISEKENIYVPHNYHYISEQEKINHAKKYNMTLNEFEEKYVNNSISPVNNITFKVERCDSENSTNLKNDIENMNYSDSSENDEKENKQIDPEFLQLIKNIY